jgi:urea transport system ATP-binding protein
MEFVRQFAQTVTVLHLGRVLSEGTMEKVQQDPEVVRAYLGHGVSGQRTVGENPRSRTGVIAGR